ncbi:M15 family metallopeptidase [Pontimicrobium aquaticum]|uniref:D-alanyl-D-alanine dipeptidase n=1 Tax=Pontimicrobium aquaticum TaxID=2565367 RepID=A0A4U0EX11_9FLAO|nr:M15 family metallopeptidase [Pontimicrobium aquaticum]TJY36348.1 peptidase M15 [Pontimicrobium aquaticum]
MKRFFYVLLICYTWSCTSQNNLPEGFGYVHHTIPDIQLELRYFGSDNFIGKPIDGYHKNVAIMTTDAINALKRVQDELKQYNLSIKIFDGYRPQTAVNHFVHWAKQLNDTVNKQKFYPKVKKEHLFEEGYISSKSGHTRGSTIDMTLVDLNSGEELDMGSPWDFFGPESWVANLDLTFQQRANRMLLQTVMRKHGFKYYTKEWWHFTLQNEPFPDTYFDFPIE